MEHISFKKWMVKTSALLVFTFNFYSLKSQQDSTVIDSNLNTVSRLIELEGVSIFDKESEVIKGDEFNPIEFNSTANMDKVLEGLSGVQLVKRGGFALDAQINGLSKNQITVTIDGMRIFGACTDRMDPATSYLEPVNLNEAEVSCHSNSSETGSTLGGSLNLKSRKANFSDSLKINGELNSGLQSASNGKDVSGALNLGNKKIALKLNGALRSHDSYVAGNGTQTKYTQFSKTNFAANLRYQLAEKWILESSYIYDEANDVGYAGLPMDVSVARTNLASVGASGYNVVDGVKKLSLKVYGNQIYHEMDDSKRPDEEVPMRMDMPGWSKTYGAIAQFEFKEIKKHNLSLKADYYQNFRRAEMTMYDTTDGSGMFMLTWPDVVRNSTGIWANDKWVINSKNQVDISARVDWVTTGIEDDFGKRQLTGLGYTGDETFVHFPQSLALSYSRTLSSKTKLTVTAAEASRAPSTSEMYGFFLFNKEDGYDYIGKPDINMEQSYRLQSELNHKREKLALNAGLGYNRINDYIYGIYEPNSSAMTIGGKGLKYYQNVDWAQFVNASFTVQVQVIKSLLFSSRFNYTWAEQYNKQSVAQIQPLNNISSLKFQQKKWFAMLETESAGKQQLIDSNFGEDQTASWAILNVRGGWQAIANKKLKLDVKAGAENVFDHFYNRHLDWGNVPRMGRNFYLNVGVRF